MNRNFRLSVALDMYVTERKRKRDAVLRRIL